MDPADLTRITTTVPTGTDEATLIHIFANWKQSMMSSGGKDWFYEVGIGLYWAKDDIPDMQISKGSKLAWQAALGYNFNPSWFVEGRYMASSHPGDSGLFGIQIGYGF